MTYLGSLHHFLGVTATRTSSTLFLSQHHLDLLNQAGMIDCQPCRTLADVGFKLSAEGDSVLDPTLYRSLVGALQYATLTRPVISYFVQQACLYMHDPRLPHLAHVKKILRYLKGTLDHGLLLNSSSPTSLTVYSDADWTGCPDTRRSTSGFCVYLGDNLVSWSSKRQVTISRSSAEAEYRAVAHAVAEAVWIRQLLVELQRPVQHATIVYCELSIWPPTPCNIVVPSTSRSTFILFGKKLLLEKFVFYMFQRVHNLQIFLPKDYILRPSSIFAPVSTSWHPMLTLRGGY
uniref:Uncharacterized protein n=1 Tax=Avena sativa TaxID=4498 RepID=A0ACD5YAD9_AVESA